MPRTVATVAALVALAAPLGPARADDAALVAEPADAHDEARRPPGAFSPLRPLDARDWAAGVAVDVGLTASGSYDDTLQALGYEESDAVQGLTAFGGARLVGPLWLGGRVGFRSRNWPQPADTANATGFDGLVELSLRLPLGDWFELGASVAGGIGGIRLRINDAFEASLVPRLHGALFVGVPLPGPVRFVLRGGWDLFAWDDANEVGDDVDLGGFFVGGAVEVRPW